jgi:hypothetical protein
MLILLFCCCSSLLDILRHLPPLLAIDTTQVLYHGETLQPYTSWSESIDQQRLPRLDNNVYQDIHHRGYPLPLPDQVPGRIPAIHVRVTSTRSINTSLSPTANMPRVSSDRQIRARERRAHRSAGWTSPKKDERSSYARAMTRFVHEARDAKLALHKQAPYWQPGDGVAARKVFAIYELLQQILLHNVPGAQDDGITGCCPYCDVEARENKLSLKQEGVNTAFRSVMRHSEGINRHFWRLPYDAKDLNVPIVNPCVSTISGLSVTVPHYEGDVIIRFKRSEMLAAWSSPSERPSMLLVQPAITENVVKVLHARCAGTSAEPCVQSKTRHLRLANAQLDLGHGGLSVQAVLAWEGRHWETGCECEELELRITMVDSDDE